MLFLEEDGNQVRVEAHHRRVPSARLLLRGCQWLVLGSGSVRGFEHVRRRHLTVDAERLRIDLDLHCKSAPDDPLQTSGSTPLFIQFTLRSDFDNAMALLAPITVDAV